MDFVIVEIALGLMLVIVLSFVLADEVRKNRKKNVPRETSIEEEITQEQFERMLSMLFGCGVITQQEYNNLLVRGLSCFK